MGFAGNDRWKTRSPDDEWLGPEPEYDEGPDEEPPTHRLEPCGRCGSEGYLYSGHPNDPHPRCVGVCPDCGGTGAEWVPVEPIECDDLDFLIPAA